jgi:hypothetical protein
MENKKKAVRSKKRETLLEENLKLKDSLKETQDQLSNLTEYNHRIDNENSILRERMSNFGLRDFLKNIGLVGLGIAVGDFRNGSYLSASLIAIISLFVLLAFNIYDNFRQKPPGGKEKERV